jgi:glyoxylase-like metal-dependent hydrolase (beta-lactamase superfamily II)
VRVDPDRWASAGSRITPPIFPVRFDARFYVAEAPTGSTLPEQPPSPREIEKLAYFRPAEVVERWETARARVPPPVVAVLRAMDDDGVSVAQLTEGVRRANEQEELGPRIEFVPGIWMLPVATRTLPPATHTNVWMPGKRSFVIVDPGSDDDDEHTRLFRVVERRRTEQGASPSAVVLTHHHDDHVAGAARVASELALPVRAHADVLARLDLGGLRTEELRDGDVVDLGGEIAQVLHTPGHAPGHLALHLPGHATVIAGDLISGLSTILIDPPEGHMGSYLDSLRTVAALECRTVLPGHGAPLPGAAIPELIEHRLEREMAIEAIVASGAVDLDAVARVAYRDVPQMPLALTRRQALAHLVHLEELGTAVRSDAAGERWTAPGR